MGSKTKLKFKYKGELMAISDLMRYSLVNEKVLRDRLTRLNWPAGKALTEKTKRQINGNIPSAASVSANESRRLRKAKKFKMFAQCSGRCNPK